jgi:ABC-2 type transport system permease protein
MAATTTMTPSLEGKNYWIVQSLPISKKTLYMGKMLFNMMLTVPFTLFATVTFCISAGAPLINAVLYILLGIVLCSYSTTRGCVCGIKHMRLDWENEIEVIKQGSAVAIYMFPNMFATMALVVLVVILGIHMNLNLILLVLILIVSLLACLCYRKVMKLSK